MQKTLSDTGRIIRIGLFSWNILTKIPLPPVAEIPIVTPNSDSDVVIEATDPEMTTRLKPRSHSPNPKTQMSPSGPQRGRCMIKHIQITMLTITCICVAISETKAGVIALDPNGFVTKATVTLGGTDIDVTFVADSYNNVKTDPPTVSMPWFDDGYNTRALTLQLTDASDPNSIPNTPGINNNPMYVFAWGVNINNKVLAYMAWNGGSGWTGGVNYSNVFNLDQTSHNGRIIYYAIIDTGDSTVPEPSTAIAMGLLGIVGFAGNRRRRRQESVA